MGECASCMVHPQNLGDNREYPLQKLKTILQALHIFDIDYGSFLQACEKASVKLIICLFW